MIYEKKFDFSNIDVDSDFHIKGLFDRIIDSMYYEEIIETISIKDNYRVLDFGTDHGELCIELAKKFPNTIFIGIDNCEEIIKKNRNKIMKEDIRNVSFLYNNRDALPFEDKSFNIVLMKDTLHYIKNPENIIEELVRVLKDNGEFFISDPIPSDKDNGFIDEFLKFKTQNHIRLYNKDEYISLLYSLGFSLKDSFETTVKYSTNKINQFNIIEKKYSTDVLNSYNVEKHNGRVTLSTKFINMNFVKIKK